MTSHRLETPLHPSLLRPVLLGGAERELVLLNVFVILSLVLGVGLHLLTVVLAAGLGTFGHSLLVLAARYDPQTWQVYRRHVTYQDFYPARARFEAPLAQVHPFNLQAV